MTCACYHSVHDAYLMTRVITFVVLVTETLRTVISSVATFKNNTKKHCLKLTM